MTAKEYLRQYKEATRYVQLLETEYQKELDLIDAIKSPLGGDGMPGSGGISKRTEDKAIKLADKAHELEDARHEAIAIRQKVFSVICLVPGEAGSVLYERYINLKTWDEVAKSVGYSTRQAINFERQGLEFVKDFLLLQTD